MFRSLRYLNLLDRNESRLLWQTYKVLVCYGKITDTTSFRNKGQAGNSYMVSSNDRAGQAMFLTTIKPEQFNRFQGPS